MSLNKSTKPSLRSRSVEGAIRGNALPPANSERSGSRILWCARAALGLATVVALYLTYTSLSGSGVVGCGAEAGCSEVLTSRWSKWLGIPVSLPAAGLYLSLIWWSRTSSAVPFGAHGPISRFGLIAGAWTVIGAAVWFFFLSAAVLRQFCPYCALVHGLGVTAAVLLLKQLRARDLKSGGTVPGPKFWISPPLAAALAMGVVVAGQLWFKPATYRVTGLPSAVTSSTIGPEESTGTRTGGSSATASSGQRSGPVVGSKSAGSGGVGTAAAGVPSRRLALHGGSFQLDLYQLPLLGLATAPKVMVSQFDYTCEHCRRSHEPIRAAQRLFSNQLAVICLPMPIDAHCNEWIRRTPAAHTNACQFAALGLALWQADRTKFHEFDDWLMTAPEALHVPQALARARALVGEATLDQALADPWVAQTLQLSISLYHSNALVAKSGAMPMLTAGTNVVTGTVTSTDELCRLLDRALGLKAPQ